jgi:rhodanese-related sulfurtransferase
MFVMTNKGDQPLTIGRVVTSCGCTTAALTKSSLGPGESIGLPVSVNTAGFAGTVERTVTVQSNDPVNPSLVLGISVTIAATAESQIPQITVAEFQKRFYFLIDVRTPEEYAAGHLFGAVNIPLSEFQQNLGAWTPRLPKDVPIILQCGVGGRSKQAAQILLQAGFTNVLNLVGGITEWKNVFGLQYLFEL